MSETESNAPLASFEAKWMQAVPELRVALSFLAPATRAAHGAFVCLVHELEHAAFGIRDAEPATLKLQWWAEEFARAAKGEARHPLTQAIAQAASFPQVPLATWYAAVGGALAQRDAEPAANADALLAAYEVLHEPLAQIEARLFAPLDVPALARARALARALRETASLADALRDGRLPLPLDLLARHRLSRGGLTQASPEQVAALREWLGILRDAAATLDAARIGAPAAATLSADRWRLAKSMRADDPLAALPPLLARMPLRVSLSAWRARGA